MPKVKLTFLFLVLVAASVWGSERTSDKQLFEKGTAHLIQGNYAQSITIFENLRMRGVETPDLYCNLGDACYKTGHFGKAIYFYEKGLLLSPFDPQLNHNRDLVNAKLNILPGNFSRFFDIEDLALLKIIDRVIYIAVVLLFISSVLFVLVSVKMVRKFQNVSRLACRYLLFISIPVIVLLSGVLIYCNHGSKGIITKTITARAAPGGLPKNDCVLKEGEKVLIINFYDGWYKIQKTDGDEGWISGLNFLKLN